MKKMLPLEETAWPEHLMRPENLSVKCYNSRCDSNAVGRIEVSTLDQITGRPLTTISLNACEECAKGFGYEM